MAASTEFPLCVSPTPDVVGQQQHILGWEFSGLCSVTFGAWLYQGSFAQTHLEVSAVKNDSASLPLLRRQSIPALSQHILHLELGNISLLAPEY